MGIKELGFLRVVYCFVKDEKKYYKIFGKDRRGLIYDIFECMMGLSLIKKKVKEVADLRITEKNSETLINSTN